MALSLHNIKKWWLMLSGKSILHVNQDEGKCYSTTELKGYYNNLTAKVLNSGITDDSIPVVTVDVHNQGKTIVMTTAVFQYALGAYDLFLQNNDKQMLKRVIACTNWAVENQQTNGGWLTFDYVYLEHPFSSMSTGEGISLLIRAFIATNDERYRTAAEKAFQFLMTPLNKGGVSESKADSIYFYEYTHKPLVLNGWIFSYWGVWDYWMLTKSAEVKTILDTATQTLVNEVRKFDKSYWSSYDLSGMITSPFYHRLHIAQMKVLYAQTGKQVFMDLATKWEKNLNNPLYKAWAFVVKAVQKIKEKE